VEKRSKIILACTVHNFIWESALIDQEFDKFDEDENYMSMLSQNPSDQSINNNQFGHDMDMNAFHDFICNALMSEID
jgi:hypothetical protein